MRAHRQQDQDKMWSPAKQGELLAGGLFGLGASKDNMGGQVREKLLHLSPNE